MVLFILLMAWSAVNYFKLSVPNESIAVLIKKTGKDLPNGEEIAPTDEFKGVQKNILTEGVAWLNPYEWDWEIHPQIQIPPDQLGVLVSLTGDDLPYGEFMAKIDPANPDPLRGGVLTKGIVETPLVPGRYPINPYLFTVELHKPVVIPGGFKGVVANLSGPIPANPNTLLVDPGFRGVQKEVYDSGTVYVNPYQQRICLVDCRSQRFNLAVNREMGFPSKDGFWISLDGVIEFRVKPEKAAEVYVTYNDDENGEQLDKELIQKVITPIARSFCRVEGAKKSGREFISGETRMQFEQSFETAMRENCDPVGIEIIQALITKIYPPESIAGALRDRELAKQVELQYKKEILQQQSEQKLAVEKEMVVRKQQLIKAEQEVIKVVTTAKQEQEVALTKANERLQVAKFKLDASKDEASAITARGQAEADVVGFQNEAEAAGWKAAVAAFNGKGNEYATYVLYQKLSGAYQKMMINTADSPLMNIFDSYTTPGKAEPPK